jgi:branched-chain amino acid transport system ATP-binding protein
LARTAQVRYLGESIVRLSAHRIGARGIARTFQLVQPFSHLTVRECTMLGALFGTTEGRCRNVAQARVHADDVLEMVGLYSKAEIPAENLNIAERKRLEVARALAARPRLLLLDEVMAGLGGTEVEDAVALIRAIRSRGITIIVIEHVMQAIIGLSERVIVLHHGEKIADGPVAQVLADDLIIRTYTGTRVSQHRVPI